MKKVLAILFAALLIFSFAGCGDDKKDNNTTTSNTNTTVASTADGNDKQPITPATKDEVADTNDVAVADDTVEAWIAANQDVVDAFCAENSESDETSKNSMTMQITAKGNVLYMSLVMAGPDVDVILESYDEYAAEEQASWDALTAEEKLEEMAGIAAELDESMPVPEKVVQNVCKDTASNVVATVTFAP